MEREKLLETIGSMLKKEGATRIGIFGSYARKEQRPDSDIDVLVAFKPTKSLFDLVRIEREISEAIGVRVDLVTEQALSPLIRDRVRNDLEVIS
ncbi:MAG TPA: nucleotidyltransferase family protein [Candidatus Nanoarchaeia archaeon]|nr:nucleotidyltransferase family protein [Candidatus Nanoarchaeia archaeon]